MPMDRFADAVGPLLKTTIIELRAILGRKIKG